MHGFAAAYQALGSDGSDASFGQPSVVSRFAGLVHVPPEQLSGSLQQLTAGGACLDLLDIKPEPFETALGHLTARLRAAGDEDWQQGLKVYVALEGSVRHVPSHCQVFLLQVLELTRSGRQCSCLWGAPLLLDLESGPVPCAV